MSEILMSLYEDLIYLDEIAGELDPETNSKIDQQREAIKTKILELQKTIDEL